MPDSVGRQLRGDNDHPFNVVTMQFWQPSSDRREVPESDVRNVVTDKCAST